MIPLVLSLVFFALAAIMNAVMDTLQFHFERSIFKGKDPNFWNPNISWNFARIIPYTGYKVDGWHLSKSMMIIFCALSATVLLKGVDPFSPWWGYLLIFTVYGIVWNMVFNLFFDRLLLK